MSSASEAKDSVFEVDPNEQAMRDVFTNVLGFNDATVEFLLTRGGFSDLRTIAVLPEEKSADIMSHVRGLIPNRARHTSISWNTKSMRFAAFHCWATCQR
jgi:hypothetical protein